MDKSQTCALKVVLRSVLISIVAVAIMALTIIHGDSQSSGCQTFSVTDPNNQTLIPLSGVHAGDTVTIEATLHVVDPTADESERFLFLDSPGLGFFEVSGLETVPITFIAAEDDEVLEASISESGAVTATLKVCKGGCSVNVLPQSQSEPSWANLHYDNAPFISANLTSPSKIIPGSGGTWELVVGLRTYQFSLAAGQNNLNGLRDGVNGMAAGVLASVVERRNDQGNIIGYYLSIDDTVAGVCQVCAGSKDILQLRSQPGNSATNILTTETISSDGCALTCLAMAIDFAAKKFSLADLPKNPDELNQFMIANGLPPRNRKDYIDDRVVFSTTTADVSPKLKFSEKRLRCDHPSSCLSGANIGEYLDEVICGLGYPVIVGVKLRPNGSPRHYVLVTGKTGDRYRIIDPAGKVNFLDRYPSFETRGYVYDPPEDLSRLNLAVGDAADLLVTDPTGRRTGLDSLAGQRVEDIPGSVHFLDALQNDETGEERAGTLHSVNIFQPQSGSYRVVLSGLRQGEFLLVVRSFSNDGTAQTPILFQGSAQEGGTLSFNLQFSSEGGASPELVALPAANVWIGLKNSDDVGAKFDLLAEVLKNGSPVGSGQLNGVPGGSSGFNNAVSRTINLALSSPVSVGSGNTLSIRLSVRIAVGVAGHRSGTARLWFNNGAANSRFNATIGGTTSDYFLLDGAALGSSAGSGPSKTIDVFVDRAVGGNPFKPFGTWSKTF